MTLALPLEVAITLNNEMPAVGMAEALHEIRGEFGLHVMISLCQDCGTVSVIE